jgi:uncharacterized protein YfaS (alpha-2-macroglobulin family)
MTTGRGEIRLPPVPVGDAWTRASGVTLGLDKPSYSPGDTMTLTVDYGIAVSVEVTVDGKPTTAVLNARLADTAQVRVSSTPARTWTLISDDGSTAVYTAIA